jgi:LPS export ABC transporter protein LptC
MAARHSLRAWVIPVLLWAGMLVSCRNDLDKVAAVAISQEAPERLTRGAEYFFTDSGRVRNRLRAGQIAEWIAEPRRTEITEGLELVFFDTLGREASVLTARRGNIVPGDNRMEVFEEVVFTNAKGERLETEQLTWSQDSGRVSTDMPVRIQRRSDVIHGTGLSAAEDFSRYTIHRITGVIELAEEDTLATSRSH